MKLKDCKAIDGEYSDEVLDNIRSHIVEKIGMWNDEDMHSILSRRAFDVDLTGYNLWYDIITPRYETVCFDCG